MLNVNNVSLRYGGRKLFDDVNIKFTSGNCYGVIGANGAGKSTFLKILSGEIEPNTGDVTLGKDMRIGSLTLASILIVSEALIRLIFLSNFTILYCVLYRTAL